MIIREATVADIPLIAKIARETWPVTYEHILSETQISFMLAQMYSFETLAQNFESGQQFLIAQSNEIVTEPLGFAAFENNYRRNRSHLHKLYILPHLQAKGVGKQLMFKVLEDSKDFGDLGISLNVNRRNKARFFYETFGFEIVEEVNIPIGDFLMEDYVMLKSL